MSGFTHGTYYGYYYGKCRCSKCTEANKLRNRARIIKLKERLLDPDYEGHGKFAAFREGGCRCAKCSVHIPPPAPPKPRSPRSTINMSSKTRGLQLGYKEDSREWLKIVVQAQAKLVDHPDIADILGIGEAPVFFNSSSWPRIGRKNQTITPQSAVILNLREKVIEQWTPTEH